MDNPIVMILCQTKFRGMNYQKQLTNPNLVCYPQ